MSSGDEDSLIIRSDRLDLVSLPAEALRLSLARDRERLERILGLSLPAFWFDQGDLIERRLAQVTADPAYGPWGIRAIVRRDASQVVGIINCHTKPGDPYLRDIAPQGVELGFRVFEPFRRRGYAREACEAVMRWAHQVRGVDAFVLSIAPDNEPSLAIARRLGFVRVGSHVDEIDGPEDVYRLQAREPTAL